MIRYPHCKFLQLTYNLLLVDCQITALIVSGHFNAPRLVRKVLYVLAISCKIDAVVQLERAFSHVLIQHMDVAIDCLSV